MTELVCVARNIWHQIRPGEDGGPPEIVPIIEAVLHLSRRTGEYRGIGLSMIERIETIRFSMTLEAARKLRDNLDDWIDAAEDESQSMTLRRPDNAEDSTDV